MEDRHRPRSVIWTDEENKRLLDAVKLHGRDGHDMRTWELVAAHVSNRTANQCQQHYFAITKDGHQCQKINEHWTVDEDKRLVEAMQQDSEAIDSKKSKGYWDRISTYVTGRSAKQCCNRFNTLSFRESSHGRNLFEERPTNVATTTTTTTSKKKKKKKVIRNGADSDNKNNVDNSTTLQAEVTRLRERNQSLKTKKTELKTALKAALYDVDKSDKKINHLTAEAAAAKEEAAAAKEEVAKWINVSKVKDATIESFAEKVTDVVEDSQKEIQQLKDQVGDLLATVDRLKLAKKEMATSKNEKHVNQKLREELSELSKMVDRLKKENELLSDRKVSSNSNAHTRSDDEFSLGPSSSSQPLSSDHKGSSSSNAHTNSHNGLDAPSSPKRKLD